jgi:hypothetical protein
MDNQQVTGFELGWLVGAIDGEGCVGISRRQQSHGKSFGLKPHIQIANCDKDFIDRYVLILDKLAVPYWISHHEAKGRRNESWQVATSGLKRTIKLLPTIANLLCKEKRTKALLVQEFVESRLSDWHAAPFTPRQLEIYQIVADLNVKGFVSRNLRDYTRNNRSSKVPFVEDIVQAE